MKSDASFFAHWVCLFVGPAAVASQDVSPQFDSIISKMTLEEKVGQLLFVGFGGTVMDDTIASFSA